eukprot:9494247-Pyramimonas_sp.AAC.1
MVSLNLCLWMMMRSWALASRTQPMSRLSGRSTKVTSERSWKHCRQPDSSAHAQLSFDDDRLCGKDDVG